MRVVYEAWNLIDAHPMRGEALLGAAGELPACGLPVVCVTDSCQPQARALLDAMPLLAGDAGHAGPIASAGAVPA
jgi:hypothetical protein